jgi:hypothetical protein
MVTLSELEIQLKKCNCIIRSWGRSEMRELARILLPGEVVRQCINGQYEGGFAMLAATDIRVLLIDKKPMYLSLEDIRFDMIAEVDYNHNVFNATLRIFTPNQTVRFTGFNQTKMRDFFNFVQRRVMEIRQHYMMLDQPASNTLKVNDVAVPGAVNATQILSDQPANSYAQVSHLQIGLGGMRRIAPVISAYTRLPMKTQQRHFLGYFG